MINLFEVQGNIALPSEHALMLSPFKEIWERDEDEKKSSALKQLTYVEFMCSFKKSNPFSGYSLRERHKEVTKKLYGEDFNYIPDGLVQEAIQYYEKLQDEASISMSFYKSVVSSVEQLQEFLNSVDLNERSEKGVPIYKPTDVTRAINDSVGVLQSLTTLKEKVQQELFQATKTKSQREIGEFER